MLQSKLSSRGACARVHHTPALLSKHVSSRLSPFRSKNLHTIVPHASSAAASQVESLRHITADGWGLELLCQRAEDTGKPQLLFVHGSYHAAWCWKEKFMPYFADKGYTCYAVSLRAQGNSDCISNDKDTPIMVAGTLDSHASDLADLIEGFSQPPVVVAHSFGGLILQKYLLKMANGNTPGFPKLAGVAFLCSVPPSGNKDMVLRFFSKDIILSLKITWGFIAKTFANSLDACRELFFSKDIPIEDLVKFQKELAGCSPVRLIDLNDVNKQVPLPIAKGLVPTFVLGGEDDKVVDVVAIQELAAAYGVEPVVLPNVAHDCMLDTRWEQAAEKLASWLGALKA